MSSKTAAARILSREYVLRNRIHLVREISNDLLVVDPRKGTVLRIDGIAAEVIPHLKHGIKAIDAFNLIEPRVSRSRDLCKQAATLIKQLITLGIISPL